MPTTLARIRAVVSVALLVVGVGLPRTAAAQLTFDDVATNAAGYNNNFTSYNGLSFFNFNVATTASLGTGTNAVSGTKFALGQEGSSSIGGFGQPSFNLFSAWLSYRQFDTVNLDNGTIGITVLGYRAGIDAPVFQRLLGLTNTAQLITFEFVDVEEVVFETAPLIDGGRSSALAVDNVQLGVVPEPATVLLLATGLAALLVVTTRRRRRG